MDRFVPQAILQVLMPVYDPTFSDHSFGFRPRRNTHQAVRQAYYKTNGTKEIQLYRGTGGRTGMKYRNEAYGLKRDNPQFWGDVILEIEENAVTGWSSDERIASNFGHHSGGITEIAKMPVENIILPHETWPKNSFQGEQEFLVLSPRKRAVPLKNLRF